MPDPPRSRGKAGVWVVSVLVDDRPAVETAGAAAAATGQHRRARRTTGEAPAPAGAGRDLLPGAWRHRLGGAAGGVPAGQERHLAVDTGGLLLTVVVTLAGIQDR